MIDRLGFLEEKQVSSVGKDPQLRMGYFLGELLNQGERHDPVLGPRKNQGGLANELNLIPAVEMGSGRELMGKGV